MPQLHLVPFIGTSPSAASHGRPTAWVGELDGPATLRYGQAVRVAAPTNVALKEISA